MAEGRPLIVAVIWWFLSKRAASRAPRFAPSNGAAAIERTVVEDGP